MASSSIKRRRERKRMDQDGDPEFQVAPMVDVLLVLMLFFMSITSTEVLKKEKNLHLAQAKNAKPDEKKTKTHETVINVALKAGDNSSAGFSMDGVDYATPEAMQSILASRIQKDPQTYVLIRADKEIEYSNIADLMTTCAAAGISSVTFAVVTGGAQGKAKAPPAGTASN